MIDIRYYLTVIETQNDPEILKNELHDLLKESNRDIVKLREELYKVKKQRDKMLLAINWACGCMGDFQPANTPKLIPKYWWRSGLSDKAGLKYNGNAGKYFIKE